MATYLHRLPALRRMMIGGLIGNVLAFTVLQALILRTLIPPLAIILALTLVVAGVCATRWRWAPHLVVIWCVLSVAPGFEPYYYDLTHPAQTGTFVATLLGLAVLLVAAVAGTAAIIERDGRTAEGHVPRWVKNFVIGLGTLVLGASLMAAIRPAGTPAGVSPEALSALPAVVSGRNAFNPSELRAKAGQTVALRLENSDTHLHYFDIDEFDVHVPMPSGKPALAVFTPTTPGTYTFYCQIPGHTEAGMKGTLVVAP